MCWQNSNIKPAATTPLCLWRRIFTIHGIFLYNRPGIWHLVSISLRIFLKNRCYPITMHLSYFLLVWIGQILSWCLGMFLVYFLQNYKKQPGIDCHENRTKSFFSPYKMQEIEILHRRRTVSKSDTVLFSFIKRLHCFYIYPFTFAIKREYTPFN